MMHNGRGGGRLCKFVSTSYSILLSREINRNAQSQYNVRAHERLICTTDTSYVSLLFSSSLRTTLILMEHNSQVL